MDQIIWVGVVIVVFGMEMFFYVDGLVFLEVVVKLRVNNLFQVERDYFFNDDVDIIFMGIGENNFYLMYCFKIEGK